MKNYFICSETAERLYSLVANLPIIDYHNHLDVSNISKPFENIYSAWLAPDPYKHRIMRMAGVPERLITGNAPEKEKLKAWLDVLPRAIGTPVYMWAQAELEAVFGIENTVSADELWERAESLLPSPDGFLKKFNVEYAAPCASLTDSLDVFFGEDRLAPSLRGDNAVAPTREFIVKLSAVTNTEIHDIDSFLCATQKRIDEFHRAGCRFSDHALDSGFSYFPDDNKNGERFKSILDGKALSPDDRQRLFCEILRRLAPMYAKKGWVMQLHMGAMRSTSTRLREAAGAAGGFAGIGRIDAHALAALLDDIDKNILPKTVIFTLDPADNALVSVLSGSFARDGVSGLITQGPAWWWCDHITGIREVLDAFSSYGMLNNFIGMTTDSRSWFSFVRHDYFRRTLCAWLADKIDRKELFADAAQLENLLYDVCYKNASDAVRSVSLNFTAK